MHGFASIRIYGNKERPEECKLLRTNHEEMAVEYIIPKRWVKVQMNRIMTDEQLQVARERAAANGFGRRSDIDSEDEDESDDADEDEM
jgi:hypothetical protein